MKINQSMIVISSERENNMQVKEFVEKTGFKVYASQEKKKKEITGVFVGDLLSWVMGNCEENQVWITVQSHLNIVAVSALKEISCLVIAHGAEVEEETMNKAIEENIAICTSDLSAYDICKKCAELGL